jgi:hypothetical protein
MTLTPKTVTISLIDQSLSVMSAALEATDFNGGCVAYLVLRFTADDFPRLSSISNSIC